jgi:hypothetical protein
MKNFEMNQIPKARNEVSTTRPFSLAVHGQHYFSERVGKTASFSPAWNCGPILPSEMLFGKSSSKPTSRTRATKSSSQSGTRRRCDSKLATESRLMLQPRSWSFVANRACDQPFFTRHFLTCGPIRFFAGFFTPCDGIETARLYCVHTNTEKALLSPAHQAKYPKNLTIGTAIRWFFQECRLLLGTVVRTSQMFSGQIGGRT